MYKVEYRGDKVYITKSNVAGLWSLTTPEGGTRISLKSSVYAASDWKNSFDTDDDIETVKKELEG